MKRPPPPSFSPVLAPSCHLDSTLYSGLSFFFGGPRISSRLGFRIVKQIQDFVVESPILDLLGESRILIQGHLFCSGKDLNELLLFFEAECEEVANSTVLGEARNQTLMIFSSYWFAFCEAKKEFVSSPEQLDLIIAKRQGLIPFENGVCGLCGEQDSDEHVCAKKAVSLSCELCKVFVANTYLGYVRHLTVCSSRRGLFRVSLGEGFDLIGHDCVQLLLTNYLAIEDVKRMALCNSHWAFRVSRVLRRCAVCNYCHPSAVGTEFWFHSGTFNTISYDAVLASSAMFRLETARNAINENLILIGAGVYGFYFLGFMVMSPLLIIPGFVGLMTYNAYVSSRRIPQQQRLEGKKGLKKDSWTCCNKSFTSSPCCVCRNGQVELADQIPGNNNNETKSSN